MMYREKLNISVRSLEKVIRAILAHDAHYGIGKNGTLPWPKNSKDLQWFKECTNGCAVVMGRKTWESLPVKPLPNRKNKVISSSEVQDATYAYTHDDVLNGVLTEISFEFPVWIIGGAQLVESSLDIIDELWLNNVDGDYDCDTFLPVKKINKMFKIEHSEIKSFGIVSKWSKK